MNRRAWTAFAAVQLVGTACVWERPRILTALGPVLFLSGLALLAPGGAEPGVCGEVAVEEWADAIGDDVGRTGPDAGAQRRTVAAGFEGVESDPLSPILRGRVLTAKPFTPDHTRRLLLSLPTIR